MKQRDLIKDGDYKPCIQYMYKEQQSRAWEGK